MHISPEVHQCQNIITYGNPTAYNDYNTYRNCVGSGMTVNPQKRTQGWFRWEKIVNQHWTSSSILLG